MGLNYFTFDLDWDGKKELTFLNVDQSKFNSLKMCLS